MHEITEALIPDVTEAIIHCFMECSKKCHYDHLSFAIEAQDLETDAGGASSLDLMQVPKQIEPSSASPVVQLALCEDTQEG